MTIHLTVPHTMLSVRQLRIFLHKAPLEQGKVSLVTVCPSILLLMLSKKVIMMRKSCVNVSYNTDL